MVGKYEMTIHRLINGNGSSNFFLANHLRGQGKWKESLGLFSRAQQKLETELSGGGLMRQNRLEMMVELHRCYQILLVEAAWREHHGSYDLPLTEHDYTRKAMLLREGLESLGYPLDD